MMLLFTNVEKNRMTPMMNMAPMNAPVMMEKKPEMVYSPAVMVPPMKSMTRATPRLAPVFMPKMDGPANGLLKVVCSISPEEERAAPQNSAVRHWGSLDSKMMKRQLSFSPSPPDSMLRMSEHGICTDPNIRPQMNSMTTMAVMKMPYFKPVFSFMVTNLFAQCRLFFMEELNLILKSNYSANLLKYWRP